MTHRRWLSILAAASLSWTAHAQSTATHPDFEGIWSSATATPLERPVQLKDKAFFTPQEAAAWEHKTRAQNKDGPPPPPSSNSVGTYNAAFREVGGHVVKTLRTSIITDPPDGRIPPLTPTAAAEKRRRQMLVRQPHGAKDLGLQDRCLIFPTAVPPMLPYSYNSNYQIVQTGTEILIHAEMPHETRIIHMDGRPHLPASVRLWLGDSIGRWEGATLVVETTNFNDGGGFYGEAGGMFGFDRNLRVIERLTLSDPATILYQFEVDDPTAFTRGWKGEMTWQRTPGPIYEYACHEGNYAIPSLIRAAQARDPKR